MIAGASYFSATTQSGTARLRLTPARQVGVGRSHARLAGARFEQLLPVWHDLADLAEVSAERRA